MHSSRIRTVRCSGSVSARGVSTWPAGCLLGWGGGCLSWGCLPGQGGVCLARGVSAWPGGVCLARGVSAWPGGCLPRWVYTSPPNVDRMIDTIENITFPQLLLQTIKRKYSSRMRTTHLLTLSGGRGVSGSAFRGIG